MYHRTFPKLHHRPAAEFIASSPCSIGFLGTPVRKRATQCSLSVNAVDQRAIFSKSSEKARSQVSDFQHRIHTTTRQLDTKDIIIDDLQATLEAHRTTNRAAILRKINTEVQPVASIYRPPLDKLLAQNEELEYEAANTSSVKGKWQIKRDKARFWPADSVQCQRLREERHERGSKTAEQDDGEYVARNFRPQGYWQIRFGEDMQRPWLAHMNGHDGDGLTRLEAEIRAYESYMRLTADEDMACQLLIKETTSIVGMALPNNPLEVIGSHRTGLATPTSDIDFSLSIPEYEKEDPTVRGPSPLRPQARKARKRKLFILGRALKKSGQFVDVRYVHARVPIVTALHRHTGLTVNFQGLHNTSVSRTCIAVYLSEYRTLRPLYILLRSVLDIRLLTTVFAGGFGSYAIVMMIVNALKHASISSPIGYGIGRHDLAAQLFWVLDFYAAADLRKTAYSPDPPSVFPKVARSLVGRTGKSTALSSSLPETVTVFECNPKKPYLLCLQDPADPLNDLGKKSYSIMHVQETFRQTSKTLKRELESWDNMHPNERKVWPESLLDALVGAHYGHFAEMRRILAKAAADAGESGWGVQDRTSVPILFGRGRFTTSKFSTSRKGGWRKS